MSTESPDRRRPSSRSPAEFVVRSLLPIAAVLLLLSTLLVGPWGFLLATVAWWRVVSRMA